MGDSISVEGLKVLAGRAGVAVSAAERTASSAGAPPYFESDSPGRTKGVEGVAERGVGSWATASQLGEEDASAGVLVDHPGDEDLSAGTPADHPTDEDLSAGTPAAA
jgi:hypothetical protein